jgi:pyridoxamine 5'-phosphate oxidase
MNREEILQFLNANPSCHLATTDGNQPRIRGMLLYKADPTGLIFHTGAFKALYNQITQNKHVELCFNSKDTQVRVAGIVEIINDLNLKKEIVGARPFLRPLIEERGYDVLVVFRVTACKATVWTMATNLEPTKYTNI